MANIRTAFNTSSSLPRGPLKDLDFQDYAPQQTEETSQPVPGRQKPEVVIKIPDNKTATAGATIKQKPSTSSNQNTLGNILQNVTTNFPASGLTDEALRQFIRVSGKQRQQQPANTGGNWGLNYFAQYFDVTTSDVLQRILWSAVPIRKTGLDLDNLGDSDLIAPLTNTNVDDDPMSSFLSGIDNDKLQSLKGRPYSYMERFIQSRPDLYGPFWVSTTLIFTVAIFSNIISFSNFRSKEMERIDMIAAANVNNTNHSAEMASNELVYNMDAWHYSMEELNMTTSAVMMYVTLLPTFLWFLFWFRGCTKYYTLIETICAYGYSLSIFIPLSLLFLIQAIIFRYLVLGLAVLLSGLVLLLSFVPIVQSDPNPTGSRIVLALVPGCHLGLAYIIHRIMLQ